MTKIIEKPRNCDYKYLKRNLKNSMIVSAHFDDDAKLVFQRDDQDLWCRDKWGVCDIWVGYKDGISTTEIIDDIQNANYIELS